MDYIETEKSINNDFDKVPTKTYYEYYDKIGSVKLKLLNWVADREKSSVSYSNFRLIVPIEFGIKEFSDDIIKIMSEFRDKRNWLHHWPQSILNIENNILSNESDKILVNCIINIDFEYYDIQWLNVLFSESYDLFKKIKRIYKCILLDYSTLIEVDTDNIHIKKVEKEIRLIDNKDIKIPNISWQIQRRKL